MLCVLIRILLSTHNIQFHDKLRNFPRIYGFLSCRKNFVDTKFRVQIRHGKQAICVRATEIRLCTHV